MFVKPKVPIWGKKKFNLIVFEPFQILNQVDFIYSLS